MSSVSPPPPPSSVSAVAPPPVSVSAPNLTKFRHTGSDFSSPLASLATAGMPMMSSLFPPVAMAAARQLAVAQQQNSAVSSASVIPSSVTPSSAPGGQRMKNRTSPTKIPRVGQGQVTCNCGVVFPNLEILEHHAKEVHPENTNLVSYISSCLY